MNENQDWLVGGGKMGELILSMDWSKNTLGPIEKWPQSLKTAVSLCLSSTFPINIVWGPEHIQIYNDAYRPICGSLHPTSMGSKFKECWASALPVVGSAFDSAFNGKGTYIPNQRMFLERYGYLEESFMTFSFSPIRDESGNVGGIFHPISESTEKMLSSRRTQVIKDLGSQIATAKSLAELYQFTKELAPSLEFDLPFMIFAEDGDIIESFGLEKAPTLLDATKWALNKTTELTEVKDLESIFGKFQSSIYEKAPVSAIKIPIFSPGSETPTLIIIAGVSSARELDNDYRGFYETLKNTFTTAVSNILAYEEEQKRAEALAQIDRAKTAFFSNVSHEFRTPLTLILGPLEDSMQDSINVLNETQMKRQEVIHRNATRMLKLVNSLLDFSRIEAGRMQASFAAVNISQFTADLASLFRSTVEKAGLKLEIDCPPLPEDIFVDKEMWEKIILNLLSNAFKFTFEGTIAVRTRFENNEAVIEVSDSGIGVSAEELPRLFERFHRVQGAKSRTYEGTGIGLALVQELITIHGGSISATSKPNVGTTFTIRIPKGDSHLPKEMIQKAPTLSSTAISASAFLQEAFQWIGEEKKAYEQSDMTKEDKLILLVDDNNDMREYVASILEAKWNVVKANNGQEAFDLAKKHKPDLILTDVMMPILDGFGLLQKIRESSELSLTPVILLSARAGEEAKVEGLNAGADDYFIKPFSTKELISRVEASLKLSTARLGYTEEMLETVKLFKLSFAHASVNIALLDLEGKVLDVNDGFLLKTGFVASDLIGRSFTEITHPDDIKPNLEHLKDLLTGKSLSKSFNKRYLKKDGSHFWVRTTVSIAPNDFGKPAYLIAVSQDIDDMKVEEEKLKNENLMRDNFVATITHDLRSPMTAVMMNAQIMKRKADNPELIQSHALRIVNNINRADKMIQDLLDANLIRAGAKIQVKKEKTNLSQIIKDIAEGYNDIYNGRLHSISNTHDLTVMTSGSGISRAVDNLITNAFKYGLDDTPIEVVLNDLDGFIEISVKNSGDIIKPEDLKNIFEPYKRTQSAEKGVQKGWGLGLTLVKGVAEALDGNVSVISTKEKGTVFTMKIPKVMP
jgi:PAS domain S-box-containing protein